MMMTLQDRSSPPPGTNSSSRMLQVVFRRDVCVPVAVNHPAILGYPHIHQ